VLASRPYQPRGHHGRRIVRAARRLPGGGGVAIAQNTVFVEATGSGNEGYLIAYGAGSG